MTPHHPLQNGPGQFEQLALGHARRRILLVAALLGGLCVAGSGAAWAVASGLLGGSVESGLVMVGVGAVLAGVGWLATLGLRFTRRDPKPLNNAKNMESSATINVVAMWIILGLVWVACLALFLFSPHGREPDAAVLLPSFMAFPAVLLGGVLYIRGIVRRRKDLFATWLARHGR